MSAVSSSKKTSASTSVSPKLYHIIILSSTTTSKTSTATLTSVRDAYHIMKSIKYGHCFAEPATQLILFLEPLIILVSNLYVGIIICLRKSVAQKANSLKPSGKRKHVHATDLFHLIARFK